MFNALVLTQEEKTTKAQIQQLQESDLPEGDVLVEVEASSLNYKDGLAVTGTGKIIRDFPMVPGIDFAGRVIESSDERYKAGDQVILTGWGVGERHWGGMAERARVKADWLVPMPANCDANKAMMIGTAGLTAMLCVQARPLERQRWAGVVDTVGSQVLAHALSQVNYGGTAAICGLAGGHLLPTTVMPFILRNVRLQGVDSVACPYDQRLTAWKKALDILPESFYEQACHSIGLGQVADYAHKIVRGQVTGRVIITL
ncbi:alcohol dehydrogenase catalytic domain-containing protein [Ferrimonas futtsuensis]|uniref:alcohol dehydrogenase catalytic domain-containing protein n=1 Tax=Ferrimonas futtsuensis TaxID=364764 RepID=UPI00040C2C07|nr:alcohol dehydrogenase catalytic domain-containing protein [Ferrimonas futtsuensis]